MISCVFFITPKYFIQWQYLFRSSFTIWSAKHLQLTQENMRLDPHSYEYMYKTFLNSVDLETYLHVECMQGSDCAYEKVAIYSFNQNGGGSEMAAF